MPVHRPITIPRLRHAQFGALSFRVMEGVFALHRESGRLFNERTYKQELARRLPMKAIQWVNIANHCVTFTTLRQTRGSAGNEEMAENFLTPTTQPSPPPIFLP